MNMPLIRILSAAAIGLAALSGAASAETRVALKSAKTGTSYYQMAVQLSETVKQATGGEVAVTVEESQGSVQNVKEVANREGGYMFTSPPSLVHRAMKGGKDFEGQEETMGRIRALFPIPSLTMHFVMRADAGVAKFADLEGKTIIIGKGSFGANQAAKYIEAFGLDGKVTLADVELNQAVGALKDGQVQGFVTAGSWPAPNVIEAAAGTPVTLLSFSDEEIKEVKGTKTVIPAGTYPGVDEATSTTSLPVGVYTTDAMDDDTAYAVTKAFWDNRAKMAESDGWWKGVSAEMLSTMAGKLHPGAAKYYAEAGIAVPDDMK